MDRRKAVSIVAATLAAPRLAFAQAAPGVYRIAILDEVSETALSETWTVLRDELRRLGYVDGKNVAYESRHANGATERLPALAAELAAAKPNVIVSAGTPATRAAIRATSVIPIVFIGAGDPVATGLVASLSRPGRNVTGISSITTETGQKAFDLLLELAPGIQRVALLTDTANQGAVIVHSRIEEHARKLKISTQALDVAGRDAIAQAFDAIQRDRIQGVVVGAASTVLDRRNELALFLARAKLPAVWGRLDYVQAGALLCLGVDRPHLARRGASHVNRILRGAKPQDLAVEQISVVRLVLNMKTARALGIKIPDSIRLRADEVIE